jgi:hypothetical protein
VLFEPPPGSLALTVTVSAVPSLTLTLAFPLLSVTALPLKSEAEPVTLKLTVTPESATL